MNNESKIEAVELSIEQANEHISNMKALANLTNNKDFTNIVLNGYFKEEASRLVLLKAEPTMQEEKHQNEIDKSIIAIGYLRQYFNTIMQFGRMAERGIEEDKQTREELLMEAI